MDQQKKLYVAASALAVVVGLLFVQRQGEQSDAEKHSAAGLAASLPQFGVTEEQAKSVDRILISVPAKEAEEGSEAKPAVEVELVKTGEESWELKKPSSAKANASNVKSLLDNLPKLNVREAISTTADDYDRWGVTDEKALHATFLKGDEKVMEAYFGESGSRGQMTRLAGHDGVYAAKGYSKWLYERDAKGWRDKSMFKFDEKEVVKVSIDNESGRYVFEKNGEEWKGRLKGRPIKEFKPSKVDDLLRAYKSLSAMDFGDDKKREDVGLAKPVAKVTIELTGGKALHVLEVGDKAEGSNRWAVTNGSPQIYSISSWSADWAMAEPSKFQDAKSEG